MQCPFCNNADTIVKDTRPSEESSSVRRRRQCAECQSRFTTIERPHLRELFIKKKDGRVEAFDREKLTRSIRLALHKRPVDNERIEKIVSTIIHHCETRGENEIPSHIIGESLMTALLELDPVAYIRFASIYKDFHKTQDFRKCIEGLETKEN